LSLYHSYKSWIVIPLACMLVVIAASRIMRINEMAMYPDEVWSIWQTFGTPQQILAWTPYDWPPGYYLTLGAWRALTGAYPIVARYLSILAFMIGAASLYRVMRRLSGERAGILSTLAYATFGYGILLSTEVRGYALLLALMPLAFWFTLRYFDYFQIRRALLLGVCLAAMFYVSVTSIGAFFILGVYTLVVYGKRVWRWWLPGLVAVLLALSEITSKFALGISRTEATRLQVKPPLLQALGEFFAAYAGETIVVWVVLFLLTAILVFYRRALQRETIALFIWVVATPILLYISNPLLGFFSNRYSWWIMVGLAMWAGWGLSLLPRVGTMAITTIFAVMMFTPIPIGNYIGLDTFSPLEANFRTLSDYMTTGDVFVTDPSNRCGGAEEWDYFLRAFYPDGLQFVQDVAGYRRVWYVMGNGPQNPTLSSSITEGRIDSGQFVGPPTCLFRLYEAPPSREGVPFNNGMRFHGIDIMDGQRPWSAPVARREGESVRIRVWWSVDRPVDLDYSVGMYLLWTTDGSMAAQVDGPPQLIYPQSAPPETSRWTPGDYYIEERELTLPLPAPKVTLILSMAVYYWENGVRVAAPGVDNDMVLRIQPIYIKAY
jgi:hypothetical protein